MVQSGEATLRKRCAALVFVGVVAFSGISRADGSIAFDRDSGSAGISWNFRGPRGADNEAISQCGGNCRIVGRYEHQCAAIAVGRGRGYGWAARSNLGRAKDVAIENCESNGDRGCRIKTSGCDE